MPAIKTWTETETVKTGSETDRDGDTILVKGSGEKVSTVKRSFFRLKQFKFSDSNSRGKIGEVVFLLKLYIQTLMRT